MTSAHDNTDTRIFYRECRSLAAAGYEVYLVAAGESREEAGVRVIGLGAEPGGRLERMTKFAQRVYEKALSLDCDVYHFHDPELLPYGVKLAKRGKKVIFDSHENSVAQLACKPYLPHWLAKLASVIYKAYETRCVRRFTAVIIPCTFDGKNIFEGRARRTVFVENYPILSEFGSLDDIAPEERIESDVCYTGSITENNGIVYLSDAAAALGARLLFAGWFETEKLERETLAKSDCIRYLGRVDRQTIRRILAGTKIGACISLDEGQYYSCDTFGAKVHEYMLAGIPALVSDSPFEKRMIDEYQFGLYVDPRDTEAVKAAIRRLLDDPDYARKLGENGRRAALEHFNWSTQEAALLELYASL